VPCFPGSTGEAGNEPVAPSYGRDRLLAAPSPQRSFVHELEVQAADKGNLWLLASKRAVIDDEE